MNRLWKRMDKLESEKRNLQIKLDQPVSEPPSPRDVGAGGGGCGGGNRNEDRAANLANNIHMLRQEVARLRQLLNVEETNHQKKMAEFSREEKHIREENLRLQRKLQLEMDRREALCRHLSESESSLEMEEERVVNEMKLYGGGGGGSVPPSALAHHRTRPMSSPIPNPSPSPTLSRPLSPGLNYGDERRESGGASCQPAVDSFAPPPALARYQQTTVGFTPIGGPRPLRSPAPAQATASSGAAAAVDDHRNNVFPRPEKFARPGGPVSASTSPVNPTAAHHSNNNNNNNSTSGCGGTVSPMLSSGGGGRDEPPASPMDAENTNS